MKTMHLIVGVLIALPTVACARSENWSFVKSTGGIAVDKPVMLKDGWAVPVRANVSGLETISEKPTMLNSALICKGVDAAVEGRNIYLTVESGVWRDGGSRRCPAAEVSRELEGKYAIFYRGPGDQPVPLGDVTFEYFRLPETSRVSAGTASPPAPSPRP